MVYLNGVTLQPKDGDVIKTMFLICGRPVIIFLKLLLLLLNNDKCGNDNKHSLTDSLTHPSTSNCFLWQHRIFRSVPWKKRESCFTFDDKVVSFVNLFATFNGCQNLTQNPQRRRSHAQEQEEAPTQNPSKRHSLATNLSLQGCYQVNSFISFLL